MKFSIFIIVFVSLIWLSAATNILFLSGIPSPSHFMFNRALAEALASRGHNITFVSPDVNENVNKNFHYIHLEQVYSHYYNSSDHKTLLELSQESVLKSVFSFYDFGAFMCEGIKISKKGIDAIKNYPENFKFDLVIYDYVCGPCLLGLLPKFKYPPVIGISAFNNPPNTVDIIGGIDKLGLTVKPFYLLNYDTDMNFVQRLHNGIINFLDSFYRKYSAIPAIDKEMKEIFGPTTPYADDLDRKALLMLVNSHPSIDYQEPLPQNVIQVGGLQIKEPKPVPDDIDSFMKKRRKGAVLLSLGTNLRSDEIGSKAITCIIEAFRQLPDYSFIWKFETSGMLKDIPQNVMIKDWVPQNDILAHPNIKLFITHAGLLSTHEAVYHGVPMVAMPFIADQYINSFRSVSAEIAVKVDYHTISTEKVKKAIVEVLHMPKYRRNIQEKSKLFRDQPEKPLKRAVWWCEYILRNPKITHLKSSGFSLGLIGTHFWDIQAMIIFVVVGFIYLMKRMYAKRRSKTIDRTKKKN